MTDAWDDEDFDPNASSPVPPVSVTDKWEGEDEDDVKDSWDAEDDDEKKDEGDSDQPKAFQRKKKKKLQDIIAEKEAAQEAMNEAKRREEEAKIAMSTPEGRLAEKLRLQKLEENANLMLAKDMLGLKEGSGIDAQAPVTKEDFQKFEKSLTEKITLFAQSEQYPDFVENLIKNLCLDLNASTLKKIKINVETLHSTKLKEEKAAAAKAKKKTKGGSLRMDTQKDIFSGGVANDYDELDDFM